MEIGSLKPEARRRKTDRAADFSRLYEMAGPCGAIQKGTNEDLNGLLREFYPIFRIVPAA